MIKMAEPMIDDDDVNEVIQVLKSKTLTQGSKTLAFEREFAAYVGTKYAVSVNSGTSALLLGCLAAGIGKGDEVLVPSFSFAATANAVSLTGAKPIFVDIDLDDFCISPEEIEKKITKRSKAVMVVHLYGCPAKMNALTEVSNDYGLMLIEDCAQSQGSKFQGRTIGSFGRFSAFSFYPTKNITTGEGGMVLTDDLELAEIAKTLRSQGMKKRYVHELIGFNFRLSEMASALGLSQLKKLDDFNSRRAKIAKFYNERVSYPITPKVAEGNVHSYNQYTVRIPGGLRDQIKNRLEGYGIESAIYYPLGIHEQPAYSDESVSLANTRQAISEVLSIPIRPSLTDSEVEYISEKLNDSCRELKI